MHCICSAVRNYCHGFIISFKSTVLTFCIQGKWFEHYTVMSIYSFSYAKSSFRWKTKTRSAWSIFFSVVVVHDDDDDDKPSDNQKLKYRETPSAIETHWHIERMSGGDGGRGSRYTRISSWLHAALLLLLVFFFAAFRRYRTYATCIRAYISHCVTTQSRPIA